MTAYEYQILARHFGHAVEIASYGNGENLAFECSDCHETLMDWDR